MGGRSDLDRLLAGLAPVRVPGEFVFVTGVAPEHVCARAVVHEAEGVTCVVARSDADTRSLAYDFVAAWITLEVRSSLGAVGLTAAVSAVLAHAGISCNVLAGYFHDHLLVPVSRADEALELLRGLGGDHRPGRGPR